MPTTKKKTASTNGRAPAKKKAAKKATPRNRISGDLPAEQPLSTQDQPMQKGTIVIPAIDFSWVEVEIIGTGPLVINKFREAALKEMEDGQQGGPKQKKPPRKPEQEFREANHVCYGGYTPAKFPKSLFGFPAIGVKKAVANAAYRFGGAKNIVSVASVLFFHGEYSGLVPIYNPEAAKSKGRGKNKVTTYAPAVPTMRRDMVVLQGGKPVASIAYRPEYYPWKMDLQIRYWDSVISLESLVNAISMAGQLVGVGSWRVENKGDKGMFRVGQITELPKDYVPQAKQAASA